MAQKRKSRGQKAAATHKRRAAAKKAARTRSRRSVGRKAAITRSRRAGARKAAVTRALKQQKPGTSVSTSTATGSAVGMSTLQSECTSTESSYSETRPGSTAAGDGHLTIVPSDEKPS